MIAGGLVEHYGNRLIGCPVVFRDFNSSWKEGVVEGAHMMTVEEVIHRHGTRFLVGKRGVFYDATPSIRNWRPFEIISVGFSGMTGRTLDTDRVCYLTREVLFILSPNPSPRLKALVIQVGWARSQR